jgi:hypothetical protein
MKEQIDGGPAFPVTASTGDPRDGVYCRDGMSLRDYFAAKAMAAYISCPRIIQESDEHVAERAYSQSDAMLAARANSKREDV